MRFSKQFQIFFLFFEFSFPKISKKLKKFDFFCCFLSYLFVNKSILLFSLLNLVNLVCINQKRSAILKDFWLEAVMHTKENPKKVDFENPKSKIVFLVLKQSSISAVFPIVRFAGDQKTALTG